MNLPKIKLPLQKTGQFSDQDSGKQVSIVLSNALLIFFLQFMIFETPWFPSEILSVNIDTRTCLQQTAYVLDSFLVSRRSLRSPTSTNSIGYSHSDTVANKHKVMIVR